MFALLGTLGLVLVEVSYLPQIFRLWRLKEANDMSLLFPGLNLCGRLLAMAYALHIEQAVFSAAFFAGALLRATLFAQVFHYRKLRPRKWPRGLASDGSAV